MPPGGGISLSVTARDLIRSGLFGKDFDTYVSEIVSYQNLRFGPEVANSIVASEQGIVMIEMVAFALSTASWYGDRQADDTNLVDARIRSAAATIARQLGYKAYSSVPPAVEITITLNSAPPARLTIEKGAKLNGPNGLSFETTSEIVFDVGDVGPKVFSARQGQTLQAIYTSSGEPNQVFLVTTVPTGSAIAQDSPEVTVDAIEWPEQPFLTFDQVNQFEFQYGFNPPRLVFGDGVAGNIPRKDSEIRLLFFVSDGTGGSVPANSVTTFTQPLVAGNGTVIAATLTHALPSTPGSDPETIASIKTNAPLVFQAAQRAVTQADLDGWINSFVDPTFGAVAIGRATVPRSVDQDAAALSIIQSITNAGLTDVATDLRNYWDDVLSSNCQANVVIAQILSSDNLGRYVVAPDGLARALETFLDAKAESTVKVHVTDGSINLLSVDLVVEVKTTSDFSSAELQQTVVTNVITALEAQLIGRPYGSSLRISDLYAVTEAIEGVDYTHITISNQPTRVDSHGDLPIQSYEVITLGALPVVTLLEEGTMAEITPRNNFPYPSEFEEPYFAPAQDNALANDAGIYANAENSQLQFLSIGVLGWDKDGISPTTGLLFWSDVIQITGWSTPFKAYIDGPASIELEDGEVLYFLMPRLLAANTQVSLYRANRIYLLNQRLHDLRLFAARVGDVLYFYNGKSLKDGDTGLLFSGGLLSTSLFPPHKHLAALVIEPPSAGVFLLNVLSTSPNLTKIQLFRGGLIQSDPADYALNLVTGIVTLVIPTVSAMERFVVLREERDLSVVTTTHEHLTELVITPPPATVLLDMLVTSPTLAAIELFRLGQLLSEPADYSLDLTTGFVTLVLPSILGDRFQAFRRINV